MPKTKEAELAANLIDPEDTQRRGFDIMPTEAWKRRIQKQLETYVEDRRRDIQEVFKYWS